MLSNLFCKALSLEEPWFVDRIEFDSENKRLDIYIDFKKGSEFKSLKEQYTGQYKAYSTVNKSWRHLNFFEHECFLHCRTPNIKLEDGSYELVKPPWAGINKGFTLLFEALIIELCCNMPIHSVSKLIKVSDNKIWRLLKKYVLEARKYEDFSEVETVGIDETSRKKRHDYISLFVDLASKKTIYVAEGRSNKAVADFANDFQEHKGNVLNIRDVSCDMSPAFIKGVKENCPNAQITFDKFHIIKLINQAVDEVRKNEVKEQQLLKGTKFIFLKNEKNLTKNQKNILNSLKISKQNLKTIRALHIRENFQELYVNDSLKDFILSLKKWYFWATHSRLEPIKKVAKTIKNHWAGVVNWYSSKINNGILEGLNSVLQAAKAKARGYKDNFQTIAYLITGNLNFQKINPTCKKT